jgi:hypothetical protein
MPVQTFMHGLPEDFRARLAAWIKNREGRYDMRNVHQVMAMAPQAGV